MIENMEQQYPENQKNNLLVELSTEIEKAMEESDRSYPEAFKETALQWLGLAGGTHSDEYGEEVIGYKSDGAGDRGIDFYTLTDSSLEIIQCKAFDDDVLETFTKKVGPNQLADINRIVNYISSIETPKEKQNRYIRKFQRQLGSTVHQLKEGDAEPTFHIKISLLIAGAGLTEQAQEELTEIKKHNATAQIFNTDCKVDYKIITVDDLLARRWRTTNSEWRDSKGKKNDNFQCRIKEGIIEEKRVKVFFAKAIDLVKAYEKFGHRIFEANVRCEIKSSLVNRKISEQLSTAKGIKEFYLLNNGVTIVANSIQIKSNKVIFVKPGIVNGLQTVTTLAKTYEKNLLPELKGVFEEECWVLVRAYQDNPALQINKLVVATNNQNVMEPRNLKSNGAVQIKLEQDFAEHGWFYQRKQFAWNAFKDDPDSWPTLKGKKKKDFLYPQQKYRMADNLNVAGAWMAFCGFSKEAMHDQKKLFQDEGNYYSLIFEKRPKKHAKEFNFSRSSESVDEHFEDSAPPASGYLFAFLIHQCAKGLTLNSKKHREAMIEKLNLSENTSKEEKDAELVNNNEYIIGLVKAPSSFLYVEIVGYLLFKKYGTDLYRMFDTLLKGTDLLDVYKNLDFNSIKKEISNKTFAKNSMVAMTWSLFERIIDSLVHDNSWHNNWQSSSSRPRLIYNENTRNKVFTDIELQIELVGKGRTLIAPWSEHIDKSGDFINGLIHPLRPTRLGGR